MCIYFQPAGCDNVLFSKKKLDVCKVCGGDGTSCRKITKWFRGKTSYGKLFFSAKNQQHFNKINKQIINVFSSLFNSVAMGERWSCIN